jgi:hypothetical protein
METIQPAAQRIRLSTWDYVPEEPRPLACGERRLYGAKPQVAFEADRVRVPRELHVVEVLLGDERHRPGPSDRREHASGVDVALAAMAGRQLGAGTTVEVLVEALSDVSRCEAVLLGRPIDASGVSGVPLSPIERRDRFELGEQEVVRIETQPMLRGHVARIHFQADSLGELDLMELYVGRDSQRIALEGLPLRFFPEGLDVSCNVEPWVPLRFDVRNRGGRTTLAIDVDLEPVATKE